MEENNTYNRVIGIDIGGTNMKACLLHNHDIKDRIEVPTNAKKALSPIDLLMPLFAKIKAEWKGQFDAIGVGVPGYIDTKTGVIRMINNIPVFSGINLKKLVEDNLNVPVKIENDANCFVMGEYSFGKTAELKHVIGITLGTGLGGGVIINGKIFSGLLCGAGEFGMIPYQDSNFEKYCGADFFFKAYGKSGKDVCMEADADVKAAQDVFFNYGNNLGNLLNVLMCAFSPEAFVFGGSIAGAFKYFYPGVMAAFKRYPVEFMRNEVKIYQAGVRDAGMLGAAALWF